MQSKKIGINENKGKTDSFLLEINTEELPTGYIKPALGQLKDSVENILEEQNIYKKEVKGFATSQRLVLYIKELSIRKSAREELAIGPPVKIAFDDKKKPTKAAIGFAKKFGLKADKLEIKKTKKGDYACVKKDIPSQNVSDILTEALPSVIKNIHFPKRMRWHDSKFSFARPIRNICCFLGDEVVEFEIDGLKSGRHIYIIKNGDFLKIKVSDSNSYFKKIDEHNIILDYKKRKSDLKNGIKNIASEYNADCLDFQKELLDEVNFLVENPYVFVAQFKKDYLKLPREVLFASMSKHQRVFGMTDNNNNVIAKFIVVTDGKPQDLEGVKNNYKMVLESRLQDSLFFYNQDMKVKLQDRIEKLKGIIYHNKLGTVYDKVKRIEKLAVNLGDKISLKDNQIELLKRSVLLSKVDLTTNIVNEFPSLQGVIGRIYALNEKENKVIADSIYEHYLPRYSEDSLPKNKLAAVISIADRIDSVVGYFGVGIRPTGSHDPYGLRRDVYAIIKIIMSHNFYIKLDEVILDNVQLFNKEFRKSANKIKDEVLDFINQRLITVFSDEYNDDIISAVFETDTYDIYGAYERVGILDKMKTEKYFKEASKIAERTKRIYIGLDFVSDEVEENLLKEPLEQKIWIAYKKVKDELRNMIAQQCYKKATQKYADTFYDLVHDFFDQVMVNVPDDELRNNRLTICKKIYEIYNTKVADLSLINCIKNGF